MSSRQIVAGFLVLSVLMGVLLDAVAFHPEFGWPSQYNMVLPGKPWVSKASRLADYPPFTSRRLKFSKFTPRHWEAYEFWNHLFHGFATPYRDLAADDVTELVRQKFHSAISDILRHQPGIEVTTRQARNLPYHLRDRRACTRPEVLDAHPKFGQPR